MLHQRATGLIKPFAHRVILSDPLLDSLGLVLLQQPGRRRVRRMRHERGIPDEERLLGCHAAVNKFGHRLNALTPNTQTRITVTPTSIRESFRHPIGKAATLIRPLPPLATLMADVALLCQPLRQGTGFVDM